MTDQRTPQPIKQEDDLKSFLLVFRQGMLLVVRWIEKRYDIPVKDDNQRDKAA